MVGVPVAFADVGERALASYDFIDIASGTGYVTYYGGIIVSGSALYILSSDKFNSDRALIETGDKELSNGVFKLWQDVDFDLVFNMPQVIKGRAIVSIPYGIMGGAGATGTDTNYFLAKFRKWDGTTENTIATAQGTSKTWGPIQSMTNTDRDTISLEIPQTTFKKGETMRLTIERWASSSIEPNGLRNMFFGADPEGRLRTDKDTAGVKFSSGTLIYDSSELTIQLPYRIDL